MLEKVIALFDVSSEFPAAFNTSISEGTQNLSVSKILLYCTDAVLADKPSSEELVAGETIAILSSASAAVKFKAKIGPLERVSIADLWKYIPFFSKDLSIPPKT